MELCSIFALPSSVADDHIKLASEYQLKVLLLFIKNQADKDVVSLIQKRLNLSIGEVEECLDYWVLRGVLLCEGKQSAKEQEVKKTPIVKDIAIEKPTRNETTNRIASCEELNYLSNVVQEKFARPVTIGELSTFVWLYDTYALPVPVIIQAIQYAYDSGKLTVPYVKRVCIDWAKEGINTLTKAEEKLNALYLSKSAWRIVEKAFEIEHRKPSAYEKKCADKWINEYEFKKDMLIAAYDICINQTGKINFKYINTILKAWYTKGYKNPSEIKEEKPKQTDKKTSYTNENLEKKINNFD